MNLLRTLAWLACFAIAFVATHRPPSDEPHGFRINDKLLHVCGFAGLAAITSWRFRNPAGRADLPRTLWIFACLAVYAAFDEITQPPFGRTADIWDWTADFAGAAAGLLLAHAVLIRRRPYPLHQGGS